MLLFTLHSEPRNLLADMGAETRGGNGGIYSPNNLTASLPNNLTMVCISAMDGLWNFFFLFWSSLDFWDKNTLSFGENLFLDLYLVCSKAC